MKGMGPGRDGVQSSVATLADLNDDIDLRRVLRTLWRRKMVLFATIVTITGLSIFAALQATPRYTAEALVVIEPREIKLVNIEAVLSGLPANQFVIETEVETIQSESLVGKVVDQLRLTEDSEFNKAILSESDELPSKSFVDRIVDELRLAVEKVIDQFRRADGPRVDEELPTGEGGKARLRAKTIEAFLEKLETSPVGRSYVISIQFESEHPDKAALIANTLADRYIKEQLEIKYGATRHVSEWLGERLDEFRQKMLEAQQAADTYRTEAGLVETAGTTGNPVSVTTHQITELSRQIIGARADRAEANARLRKLRSLLKSPLGVESAAEVLASPLIQRLREQEATVLRKEAELRTRYGERHPKMVNVRAEVWDLRQKIEDEIGKIVQGLKNRVEIARSRESFLQESMEALKSEAAKENTAQIRLKELERAADADRVLYETFLSRFKETSAQEDFQQPDARLISKAGVPVEPSFPNKGLIIALAFGGSVFLGMLLVFVGENLRSGLHSADDIQNLFGVRALGLVPTVSGLSRRQKKRRMTLEDFVLEKPTSVYSEAVRSLLAWLDSLNVDRPPKVVLVTSAIPGEGKTVFAVSLARVAARSGRKTILVDCDLRQWTDGSSINGTNGLVDFLSDRRTLEQVVQKDLKSDLHVITRGGNCAAPSDLLSSQRMSELLAFLPKWYDLVVIDSPPVLAASDARILSRMANQTVFLVRWARTSREIASEGLKEIMDAGADVAGVVLTQANLRKVGSYGYGGLRPYYGRYRA